MGIKQECVAFVGEVVGTTMFLFLGLGGIQTAQNTESVSQQQTSSTITLNNQTILFISTSMGLSLLVNAWIFYRVTGGLFNPAVTIALWFIGGVSSVRAVSLTIAQFVGGILGAGLVQLLTPYTVRITTTTLAPGMNYGQGLMLEAFLTAMLVFSVLMLAAEKHRATYLAPIGIGLVLFVCQLFGTQWTGCGMNPARSLGPSVVSRGFVGYFWIYVVGPYIGSFIAVGFYMILKAFDYGSVVLGQDSDTASETAPVPVYQKMMHGHRFTHHQKQAMAAAGMKASDIDQAEKGLAASGAAQNEQLSPVAERTSGSSGQTLVNGGAPTSQRLKTGPRTDSAAQDHGGISATGTHNPIMKMVTGSARSKK